MYHADLSPTIGSEQDGVRPVLIIKTIQAIISVLQQSLPLSHKPKKTNMPTHYPLPVGNCLDTPSIVLLEQMRTIDKVDWSVKSNGLTKQR